MQLMKRFNRLRRMKHETFLLFLLGKRPLVSNQYIESKEMLKEKIEVSMC